MFLGGRRAAFATTLGIAAGCMIWAIASAAGVAALLAASETAYDALRLVGRGLPRLAGDSEPARRPLRPPRSRRAAEPARRPRSPFRQGLLTNLFNPKIALFYTTFLPQFIRPGDPVLLLSIGMAGVHILLGIVWLSAYAWLLDRAVDAFKGSRLRRTLDAVDTARCWSRSAFASRRTESSTKMSVTRSASGVPL